MTWEETIIQIRKQPEFSELVAKAYFDEDLVLNVERFKASREYAETKSIIAGFYPDTAGLKILDIGSGNGISAISFALDGNCVTVAEPDTSDTVGSGAIRKLIKHHRLSNVRVADSFGERMPFESAEFDMVYIRQAMHHANDLNKFVSEAARVLKPGGLFLTVRDHVVFDKKDKQWFLDSHPLQKYYEGENAFTEQEYRDAMEAAGLKIKKTLRCFDSAINYFPMNENDLHRLKKNRENLIAGSLAKKLPLFLSNNHSIKKYYSKYVESKLGPVLDEKTIPGRMYSFIALK
jgi:ubiquinone/menaquinone biosynthesis C-methylase UbiE